MHGRNADEFLLMVEHGMTPMAAIQAATVNAADLLGLAAEAGTIEPGKSADIVAVRGDPLADIGVLRRIDFVMARGRVHRQEWTVSFRPASTPRRIRQPRKICTVPISRMTQALEICMTLPFDRRQFLLGSAATGALALSGCAGMVPRSETGAARRALRQHLRGHAARARRSSPPASASTPASALI